MPQDQTDQAIGRQAGEAVIDEIRGLIRDVRTRLEAMLAPTDPIFSDIALLPDGGGSTPMTFGPMTFGPMTVGRARSDASSRAAQQDVAGDTLNAHMGTLSATAARAAGAVRERGDRIDAILAENRRVRPETAPV